MKRIFKLIILMLILIPFNIYAYGELEDYLYDNSSYDYDYNYSYYVRPSLNNQYRYKDYVIDEYNINIIVHENNTFDITEEITAYFNASKHGIFRTIPLKNKVSREDGTVSNNRVQISDIWVSENFTKSIENNSVKIKIGDADKTLRGEKKYTIKYTYNLGKDPLRNADEIYFNLIGTDWDTVIGGVTFSITMPKDFDTSKLGFTHGPYGSSLTDNITFYVIDNVISGSYNGVLSAGDALTVRCELPDGYFVGASYQLSDTFILSFIIPLSCLIIVVLLWYVYGKDEEVIETVEFYPPNNMNSLDLAFNYKGKIDNNDVVSLMIYLANKGYIKIEEQHDKSASTFFIIKLKEYDGTNKNEKEFLEGLFKGAGHIDEKRLRKLLVGNNLSLENIDKIIEEATISESINVVHEKTLKNKFYKTVSSILEDVNTKENKEMIFEKGKGLITFVSILLLIGSFLTSFIIPTLAIGGLPEIFLIVTISLFYLPFFAVGIYADMGSMRWVWLGFTSIHATMFYASMPCMSIILNDNYYLIGFIVGIVCTIIIALFIKFLPKRTPYGNQIYGRIKGFKHFLETAEKEKLESLVMQNPTYFYDILPFTYVLKLSDKWIKKFETILIEPPTWYDGNDFNSRDFNKFLDRTITNTSKSVDRSSGGSGGSSGGGFSGGGSSGGGSGGGGGGSW